MKNNSTFKLVVSGGKGGVGKSMLASSLSLLFSKPQEIVAVDCDVDAPNLGLWLGITEYDQAKKISTSEKAKIVNQEPLDDKVLDICKFGAISKQKGKYKISPFLCEGCGACQIFYPKAIQINPVKNGEIRRKMTSFGFPLVSGQLYPGETGSGKIVTQIKKEAQEFDSEIMIIDGASGTGCPVIASLRDADFAVLITEPTPSGFSDLKRVLKVVDYFEIPWKLVINKADLNKKMNSKIKSWAEDKFLGEISYDKEIFRAAASLTPILKTDLKAKQEIREIYQKLNLILF